MKIGYKGLSKDMKPTRGNDGKITYVLGEIYTKPDKDKPVRLYVQMMVIIIVTN